MYLKVTADEAKSRISDTSTRPLFQDLDVARKTSEERLSLIHILRRREAKRDKSPKGKSRGAPLGTAPEAVLPLGAPALRAALQPAGRLFRRLLRESEKPFFPVSYTHLDVYKRQLVERALVDERGLGGRYRLHAKARDAIVLLAEMCIRDRNSCKGAMSRVRSARIICSASRKATCGNSRTL